MRRVAGIDVLSPAAAAARLAPSLHWAGAAQGRPVMVVDGSRGGVIDVPAELPVVVVAVAREPMEVLAGADVYLAESSQPLAAPWVRCESVEAELRDLLAATDPHPAAATALAQVLRATAAASLEAAVTVESVAYSMLQGSADHRGWLAGRRRRPPAPSPEPVRTTVFGSMLRVTLDRPARRNAFDAATRDALVDVLDAASLDRSITEVVLDGAGPCFCAGGDLDEFATATDPASAHAVRTTRHAGLALARVPARTVAEVHGRCVGAGVELPAFADRVRAASGTTFRLPEVAMGLIPGAGGTVSLPRRIGAARTAWLALSGHELAVGEALAWGLVDEVVHPPLDD